MPVDINQLLTLKQIVGDQAIKTLEDLFDQSDGSPPGVRADRYRADHPQLLDILDRLEGAQLFVRRQQENPGSYQLTVYALPLLESEYARKLLQIMEAIYGDLQTIYRERLSDPITVSELVEKIIARYSFSEKEIKDALFYIAEGVSLWSSKSIGFPYADNGTLGIAEFILRHPTFGNAIDQFYDWHILNPRNILAASDVSNSTDQGNTEFSFFRRDEIKRPEWYDQLDDTKKALISEIETALQGNLSALPTMGLRTLLESIILDHIDDKGNFKKNIDEFVKQGYMTNKQADLVSSVVDAGNAAAHRAYFPDAANILVCVEVVKHLAHGVYILGPMVNAMAKNTPSRPDNKS